MVLENRLGITDSTELARVKESISKARALALFETGALENIPVGVFAGLAEIHRQLFSEIYAFAGQLRTVNLAKRHFRFVPVLYLREAIARIDQMSQSSFSEIVEKYVEMNIAHPFGEGNGRSMRIWLDAMLKHGLGQVVDWSRVDKEDYLFAMERSPVRDTELKTLLHAALTDRVDDREVYCKGIDTSYGYEGYATVQTENLCPTDQNQPFEQG